MKIMTRAGDSGVTLIELLVVVVIVGILAVALGFSYQGWRGNYKIESQIKQLYADLMEARTRALTRNVACLASVTSSEYKVVEDSDNSGKINGTDTCLWGALPCKPKKIDGGYQYKLFSSGALPSDDSPLKINTRGVITDFGVAAIDPGVAVYFGIDVTDSPRPSYINPDYDCLIITQDRIRMGKWNGGTSCAEK